MNAVGAQLHPNLDVGRLGRALASLPRLAAITAPRPEQIWPEGARPATIPEGYFFDEESSRLCRVSPQGAIEPPHVGAFFYDKQNKVFYRADGPTAADWGLVTPAEMPGAMVQSFAGFLAPAHHAMTKAEMAQAFKDDQPDEDRPKHLLDARQIAEAGLRVADQRAWASGDLRIMQCRIKLEAPPSVALFCGFAAEPAPPIRPVFVASLRLDEYDDGGRQYDQDAIGVAYDDHANGLWGLMPHGRRDSAIRNRTFDARAGWFTVRIELGYTLDIYVDDKPFLHDSASDWRFRFSIAPRLSLFRYGRPA